MTYYTAIRPVQEPFDLGPDKNGRAQVAFNILAHCEATGEFLEELAQVLADAGVGSIHENGNPASGGILLSSLATFGTDAGPFLSIVETGGLGPDHTQNETSPPAYQRPGAQIVARAKSYAAARTMARNAYLALLAVGNSHIGSVSPYPLVAVPSGSGPMRVRLWVDTTDNTPTELYRDGLDTQLTIEAGVSASFECSLVARGTGGTKHLDAVIEGLIRNNGGTVSIEGMPVVRYITRTDPAWTVSASADDTKNALVFTVTGGPAHWEGDVHVRRASA